MAKVAGDVLGDQGGRLNKNVGLLGLTFVSMGSVIGSGWLFGAEKAAKVAGPAVLITWVVAGAVCGVLALTYCELGASYPLSGGTARYTYLTFGSLGGFFSGWVSWLQAVALAPVETVASLNYLSSNWWKGLVHTTAGGDQVLTGGKGFWVACLFVLFFTFVNMVGVQWLARFNNGIVIWKLIIPVLAIVAILTQAFHTGNFDITHVNGQHIKGPGGFMPFGVKGIILGFPAGVLFAYQGFEQAVQLGGEATNPKRDLPRAVILSIVAGTIIYIALQICFIAATRPHDLLTLGWSNLGAQDFGPFYDLATVVGLSWLAYLLQIDAIVSPGGTTLVYLGTTSRLSFALSRGGVAPRSLGRLNGRRVPWVSLILAAIVGCLLFLPIGGSWSKLVGYVTDATFLMYALAPIAVFTMREIFPAKAGEDTYRVPYYKFWCPAAFVVATLMVYWSGYSVNWHIDAALVLGCILLAIGRVTNSSDNDVLSFGNVLWIPAWVIGILLLCLLGPANPVDGHSVIPFGLDIVIVIVFSVAIFFWAVRSSLPSAVVRANMEKMADEAEFEDEMFGGPQVA